MPRTHHIKICDFCGQSFNRWAGQVGHRQRFCSVACLNTSRLIPAKDRFFSHIDLPSTPDGCWIWTAALDKDGYGLFAETCAHQVRAHRYMWELMHDSIPDDLQVLHNCPSGDNPSCVNPAHLFLGTVADNVHDAIRKGQRAFGERHWKNKLTTEQVQEILSSPESSRVIARRFDVSHAHIRRIRQRRSWKHLV